jgi:DNA polymerase-3 subunit chi
VAGPAPVTEISFHFNVADRAEYTCRLLRKALRKGAKIVVNGPAPTLAGLDRMLWTFDPLEFVPHVLARQGQPVAPRLRSTPVWLMADLADAGHHDVLVNLNETPPTGFESFARLIEIVTVDPDDRLAARQRWKHYETRGYAIEQHKVAA